jgi:uncharacterized BrkB/YihY/UPF0761 family membrane protein
MGLLATVGFVEDEVTPEPIAGAVDTPDESSVDQGLTAWRGRLADTQHRATTRFVSLRARSTVVDTSLRMYERDRHAAGSLLGSALALRLFLFFLPMILLILGVMGLIGRHTEVDSGASQMGITGALADQIDAGFRQGSTTPWLATLTGLFGLVTTGRSLTKALVASSGLAWQLGGRQKTSVRLVGMVVGLIVCVGIISALLTRVRTETGVAVTAATFLVVFSVYVALWSLVFLALPRGTTDPGAALPGAILVALTLTGMQAISILYVPAQIQRASTTYGAIGIAIATLSWFFIIGRVIAFSFSVNAIMFEQVGSMSKVVFSLPVLRLLPQRNTSFAKYFDLLPNDDEASSDHDNG